VEECLLRKELETHPKKKVWKENKKNRLGRQSLQSRRKFSGGARFSSNILPDNSCQVITGEGKQKAQYFHIYNMLDDCNGYIFVLHPQIVNSG
jgi:hypothetical protein